MSLPGNFETTESQNLLYIGDVFQVSCGSQDPFLGSTWLTPRSGSLLH